MDLIVLHQFGLLNGLGFDASVFGQANLNAYMSTDRQCWRATRNRLIDLLVDGGNPALRDNEVSMSIKSSYLSHPIFFV